LTFSPRAWLKLLFFLHAGDTEVGGFGVTAAPGLGLEPGAEDGDLLYVEDFVTVRQRVSVASVAFDDEAVADHFERCAEEGIPPARCGRIWLHTHPGESPQPSSTDEETFERVFGGCDWAVMFIIGRTGQTYARLAFPAGATRPGVAVLLPVSVDWERWPECVAQRDTPMSALCDAWMGEYLTNIHAEPIRPAANPAMESSATRSRGDAYHGFDRFADEHDWLAQAQAEDEIEAWNAMIEEEEALHEAHGAREERL
jgi:hypothetical protein